MKSAMDLQKQKNRFCFQGVEQDADLERTANLRLIQLLADAPPAAVAFGIVRKIEKNYSASIEVFSPFRVFSVAAEATTGEDVVRRVLNKLDDQLFNWRFGSGNGNGNGNGNQVKQPNYSNFNNSSFAGS